MEIGKFFKDIKSDFNKLRNDPPVDRQQKTKLIHSLALRVFGTVAVALAAGSLFAAGFTIGAAPILGGVLIAACVVFGIAAHDTIIVGVNKSTEIRLGIEPMNIINANNLINDALNAIQVLGNLLPQGQNNLPGDPALNGALNQLEIAGVRAEEVRRRSPHTIHGTFLEPIYKLFNPQGIAIPIGPIGGHAAQPQINGANPPIVQNPLAQFNINQLLAQLPLLNNGVNPQPAIVQPQLVVIPQPQPQPAVPPAPQNAVNLQQLRDQRLRALQV